jgi:uncharacterized Zn finger protein
MSPRKPWDTEWWFDAPPKRPPPKRGIKMKQAGTTWWGKRWIEALERMSSGYSSRLARGKTYARAGRAHDFHVSAGGVTAKVTGSREPYDVRIELTALPEEVWRNVVAAMAAKAQFAAELLDGRMPDSIDDVFTQAGKSLFPVKASDVRTECSCPDWANPCKHVAAVHFVLGEALDRDPFLLFELRGRTKTQVLEALRAARGAGETEQGDKARPTRKRAARGGAGAGAGVGAADADVAAGSHGEALTENEIATVSLGRLSAEEYHVPPSPLPSLRFHFNAPPVPGALLRQLGTPNGWSDARAPADVLGPSVLAAAQIARRLALEQSEGTGEGSARPEADAAGSPPPVTARAGRKRRGRADKG